MLYASSMLRLQTMREAPPKEQRLHKVVLIGISIIESATYIGMSVTYEDPTNGFQYALIIGRALPAPLIANYLALARPLPVTHRDIMAQVEHAGSVGILRDAFRMANDPNRSLADKVALYLSAVRAIPHDDRAQLQAMIDTLTAQEARRASTQTGDAVEPALALPAPSQRSVTSDTPSPTQARDQATRSNMAEQHTRSDLQRPRRESKPRCQAAQKAQASRCRHDHRRSRTTPGRTRGSGQIDHRRIPACRA